MADHPPNDVGQAGFTLLEVIVAFVILAMVLGASFSSFSSGFRSISVAGNYTDALLRAKSHLAGLDVAGPLVPGNQSGQSGDGYAWRLEVVPLEWHQTAFGDRQVLGLYVVSLTYSWDSGEGPRDLTMTTVRLGRMDGS
jgi:general secretion pathway protein I